MTRVQLPNRREHEIFEFVFSRGPHDPVGHRYTAGFNVGADGKITEIFIDSHKLASAMTDDARDMAMVLSIALQHGVPLAQIRHAITRMENGQPAGLAGRLLEELAARVPSAFEERPRPRARGATAAEAMKVPCPTCSGTGDMSADDGHRQNLKDTCTECGGEGRVPPRTGETPEASFGADRQAQHGEAN